MNKRVIRLFVAIILMIGLLATSVSVTGMNEANASIRAANFNAVLVNIHISGSTATCKGIVTGKSGITTKIKTQLYLQKYSGGSWKTVDSWSGSKNGLNYLMARSKYVSKGKYRTKAVFKIYAGNRVETLTRYSGTTTR